jgi:hypothetical protein
VNINKKSGRHCASTCAGFSSHFQGNGLNRDFDMLAIARCCWLWRLSDRDPVAPRVFEAATGRIATPICGANRWVTTESTTGADDLPLSLLLPLDQLPLQPRPFVRHTTDQFEREQHTGRLVILDDGCRVPMVKLQTPAHRCQGIIGPGNHGQGYDTASIALVGHFGQNGRHADWPLHDVREIVRMPASRTHCPQPRVIHTQHIVTWVKECDDTQHNMIVLYTINRCNYSNKQKSKPIWDKCIRHGQTRV